MTQHDPFQPAAPVPGSDGGTPRPFPDPPATDGAHAPTGQSSGSASYDQPGVDPGFGVWYPQAHSGQSGYWQPGPGQGFYPPGQTYPMPTSYDVTGYQPPSPPPRRPRWRHAVLIIISGVLGLGLGMQVTQFNPTRVPTPTPIPSLPATQPSQPSDRDSTSRSSVSLSKGVVLITARQGEGTGAGTGMVLTPDGRVLTNYHVVERSSSLTVKLSGSVRTYQATVLGRDASADVALLQLKGAANLETVKISNERVRVGDPVTAMGNARGQGYLSAASGKVTSLSETIAVRDDFGGTRQLVGAIETTAAAVPGDSGGPMFNAQGEVVGMTTAGSQIEQNGTKKTTASFAVPIAKAMSVVDQIVSGRATGTVQIGPKAYVGITAVAGDGGVGVNTVENGSPAARAGLRVGDTIIRLDGRRTETRTELSDVLATLAPNDTVTITWVTKAGVERSGSITLGKSPFN